MCAPTKTTVRAALAFLAVLSALLSVRQARGEGDWHVTAYGAVITGGDLGETMRFDKGFAGSYLAALAGGRRLGTLWGVIDVEAEGQIAKHFGEQRHWEFNPLIVLRWLPFPWDAYVDTSVSFGEGISYASRVPAREDRRHERASRLLDYLLFEFAFSLPQWPDWGLVARIHHRSGAWGTFAGVSEGSNFWGLGLRLAL